MKRRFRLSLLFLFLVTFVNAQQVTTPNNFIDSIKNSTDSLANQKDLMDVIKSMFHSKKIGIPPSTSSVTVLPAIGYNPSIGFLFGINFLRSFRKGDPATTNLSITQLDFSLTTKRMVIARFRTNIFTNNNKWNFQGNWQYYRNFINDYGLGDEAQLDPPVNYPIRFNYFRFTEKAFRSLGNHFYAGAGISLDLRNDIDDKKLDSVKTPHYNYSIANGFDPKQYNANGLIANVQYNTKEHPNRPYKGIYAEANIRYNSKVLGSTAEAGQLYTELRKYWSLSEKNPEHVIAFWYWGSYVLWGKLPYLELPSTAYDTYNRSGRGYTLGRFRGPDFVYWETEYRFPISQVSKFFSGVVFANFQSYSDAHNEGLFSRIEPAAGAGIRILFNKQSRTNICLDYARGKYGSNGFFFALNEAF